MARSKELFNRKKNEQNDICKYCAWFISGECDGAPEEDVIRDDLTHAIIDCRKYARTKWEG